MQGARVGSDRIGAMKGRSEFQHNDTWFKREAKSRRSARSTTRPSGTESSPSSAGA